MRLQILVLFLLIVLLFPQPAVADDPTRVDHVNKLLSNFRTPQLSPGESGTFSFNITNENENVVENVTLTMSIYMFATAETKEVVDNDWNTPYIQNSMNQEFTFPRFDLDGTLAGNNSQALSVRIVTDKHTTRGTIFEQGSYFVRFHLEFDYTNETGPRTYVMASRGYFTDQQWEDATDEDNVANCTASQTKGNICLSYLMVGGDVMDGIIPDSSFGVKEPIPMWPFYLLIVLAILFGFLGFMYYLEDNPSIWPWMLRKWLRFKGIWKQTFQKPKKPRE
jgi:hypothetical protein